MPTRVEVNANFHANALEEAVVLVTRPAHQAGSLSTNIAAAGGRAICVPTMEIVPSRDPDGARDGLRALADANFAIFTSANAVTFAVSLMAGALETTAATAAVGPATTRALARQGFAATLQPADRYDGEGLCELGAFAPTQVAGKRVVIIKGSGGRNVIEQTLSRRGAEVSVVEVYRREGPSDAAVEKLSRHRAEIEAIIVTSGDGLRHLAAMSPTTDARWLKHMPLILPSERVAGIAEDLDLEGPRYVAKRVDDTELVRALIKWRLETKQHN